MKKYFKPLIEEKVSASVDTIANELGVSVMEGFFNGEANGELDKW